MNTNEIFKEKINDKLNSKNWSLDISNKVLDRVSSKKNYFGLKLSLTSAVFIFVLIFYFVQFFNNSEDLNYYNFIAKQVDNTYANDEKIKEYYLDDDGIDRLVDDTLAVR